MNYQSESGFTLLEMIIVVMIIGILIAIFLPFYLGVLGKAKLDIAIFELSQYWKHTRFDAIGNGRSAQSLCMKEDELGKVEYSKILGKDCDTATNWQSLNPGISIDVNNSTLYQKNSIYRVSWADTDAGFGGSSGRLGRLTLIAIGLPAKKCLFLYKVDGSWNIREDNSCLK